MLRFDKNNCLGPLVKAVFWLFLLAALPLSAVMVLDLDSGEYAQITEEEAQARKEAEEKRRAEHKKEMAIRELNRHRPRIFLPEDNAEYWEKEKQKNPWKVWKFWEKGIVTNDFVNTSSNVVVITFLDHEGAAKDGVTDINAIREKYRLCCVLYPGDKYVETHDGKNGLRLAQYAQIHEYCRNARNYYGLKVMDEDWDKDGIPSWNEVRGTNIVVKYKTCSSNLYVFTSIWSSDTDHDGIKDIDEIRGTNGFVTDPMDPDSDGDGIPDGSDKYPAYSCESDDPKYMPKEWAEYWSRDNKSFYDKLLLADADPDGDGFTNKEEKMMDLNPIWPDRDRVIIFPRNPKFRHVKGDKYEGYVNFLINTNVLTKVQVWTASWSDLMRYSPTIKYLDSVPLREKVFKREEYFEMNIGDSKTHNLFAVVQPMTVHKFKITHKGKGFLHDISFTVNCRKYPHKKDFSDYMDLGTKHVDFQLRYDRFLLDNYPRIPKLLSPAADYILFEKKNDLLKWSDTSDVKFPWKGSAHNKTIGQFGVFADRYFSDTKFDFGYGGSSCYGFSHGGVYFNKQFEFETYAVGPGLNAAGVTMIGEYVPMFRTKRLTEDCSFVFKPDTMRNIRLKAKYGKEKYRKLMDQMKEFEEKLAELSK